MAVETPIAPQTEGLTAEPVSQEPKPGEQSPAPVQQVSQGNVEPVEPQQPRSVDARVEVQPKPSDYYAARELKKALNNLTKQFEELQKRVASPSAPAQPNPQEPNLPESILDDPDKSWKALISEVKILKKQLRDVENGVPQKFEEWNKDREFQTASQEAEGILAKAGVSNEDALEFVKSRHLREAYLNDPVATTQMILREMKVGQPAPQPANPNVPKKGQMVSTATGTPGPAAQPALDNLRSTMRELTIQMASNPNLRYDPKFKEQINEIERQIREKTAIKS